MDIFLITLVVIASMIIIVTGYVAPHVILWYFAMKRKTNVKSLSLLIEKYDNVNVSDYFKFSKFMGYFITAVFLLLIYLDSKNAPLTYNDMLLGSIAFPILFIGFLSWALDYFVKDSLAKIDNSLANQSIKI